MNMRFHDVSLTYREAAPIRNVWYRVYGIWMCLSGCALSFVISCVVCHSKTAPIRLYAIDISWALETSVEVLCANEIMLWRCMLSECVLSCALWKCEKYMDCVLTKCEKRVSFSISRLTELRVDVRYRKINAVFASIAHIAVYHCNR